MGHLSAAALVETYLERLGDIHSTKKQTPELAYRSALENLFNTIGEDIEPAMTANAELADTGAGRPDFGFFEVKSGDLRGVVEVKGPDEDVPQTSDGAQVAKYINQYGYVLVTNYRDFLMVVKGANGKPIVEGRCTIAADAEALWRSKPASLAKLKGEELVDFLIGAMKRSSPIIRPRDLADDLARHAREAKRRLERHPAEALEPLQRAMEEALGLHFTTAEGLNFFRSSLVQTLFYGLFSGWMLWREGKHMPGSFDWKDASEYLALPLIGDLYEEIARPKRLADLNLREPLDWSTASLNRVDEAEFFKRFDQDHAITLFYEPFLEAFDPVLRKQLGVWYTPNEIVQYMVSRVDQLLRLNLGVEAGLADSNVYILDPCCGTGSYLLEVARRIHATLLEQGHGQTAATQTRKALTSRVFGFEILPAPYVVSHLQLGVALRQMGTKFAPNERAGVYLTNALTGWEPPTAAKDVIMFPKLQEEADRAGSVKRDKRVIVILGNPPYYGFSKVNADEERDLVRAYEDGLEEFQGDTGGLNELYIRFFRIAERQISEVAGRGIISFISNYSWLRGPSHPIMRRRFLKEFDEVRVDNLHGDRIRSEKAPDGTTSETIFAIKGSSPGIKLGTAIVCLIKGEADAKRSALATVFYRDFENPRAHDRRLALLQSVTEVDPVAAYQQIVPSHQLAYMFIPGDIHPTYAAWPQLVRLFIDSFPAVQTSRDDFVVDIDYARLYARIQRYFDAEISNRDIASDYPSAMARSARFEPEGTRATLLRRGMLQDKFVPFAYRPFDRRWLYWEPETKLLDEKRADYFPQVKEGNPAIVASSASRRGILEGAMVTDILGCRHLIERGANVFPLLHLTEDVEHGKIQVPNIPDDVLLPTCKLFGLHEIRDTQRKYMPAAIGVAERLFYHLLAILWSPAYRKENEAALRQDWPRVPVPADATILEHSATLGRTVADLLLPDRPVSGVTVGKLRPELRDLAIPTKVGGGAIEEPADTRVTAGWGFRGQKNAVMCGKGRALPHGQGGDAALDIYINEAVYWSNVPADVWAMTIGGYPVVKKWLSYREFKVLGRALKSEELTYITEVVRRLKALLLLGADLDANYRAGAAAEQIQFRS
jgi:hypothetical protein